MRYTKIKSDFEKPEFEWVVLTNVNMGGYPSFTPDYCLYRTDEFEQAVDRLKKEVARGIECATLNRVVEYADGYRLCEEYVVRDGKVVFVDDPEAFRRKLHFNWYVWSGDWLNPKNGTIDT